MATSDPFGRHDWHSPQYVEAWIASGITRDDERRTVLRRLVSLMPHRPDAAIRVLDVGAGYGALSAQVLTRFPRAEVVCQDFSEPMFAHARERLDWAASRVSFANRDLGSPAWTEALDGPFDAVVSAIAIHNVRYPERIRAIYAEIFGLVAPGGCFLNADLIFPGRRVATEAYHRMDRLEGWIRGQDNGETAPEASAPEIHEPGASAPHRHDHGGAGREPVSLEDQLRWLREAGFQEVECFWKEMRSAIIGGFRLAP